MWIGLSVCCAGWKEGGLGWDIAPEVEPDGALWPMTLLNWWLEFEDALNGLPGAVGGDPFWLRSLRIGMPCPALAAVCGPSGSYSSVYPRLFKVWSERLRAGWLVVAHIAPLTLGRL